MRRMLKGGLSRASVPFPSGGTRALIYHRIGGGSQDERDLLLRDFIQQLGCLVDSHVTSIGSAARRLKEGETATSIVLTFDDGFEDVYRFAWPLLRERQLPFTIYLATAYVGGTMHWDGSTARDTGAPALSWGQLAEMVDSGLCTIGNHTHSHVRPEALTETELDRCSDEIEQHLGVRPQHFAYTWGIPVPSMEPALRDRFDTAATGRIGRNMPGQDPIRLNRIPVRRTDPIEFFRAKLSGNLLPERAYAGLVTTAKRLGMKA